MQPKSPLKRKTILETSMYDNDFKLRLRIAPGAVLHITQTRKVHEKIYGKTPGGWALLSDDKGEYVYFTRCPICFDNIDVEIMGPSPYYIPTLICCDTGVHEKCLKSMIMAGGSGKMISFNHVKCFNCRTSFLDLNGQHWGGLSDFIDKEREKRNVIKRLTEAKEVGLPEEERGNWAFFQCNVCKHPFCAGKISCAEEFELDASKLVCDGCQWSMESKDHRCFKHGKDYALFKCDFCCNVASWACYSHHYCHYCHDHQGYRHPTPCPGGSKCPLGMHHPPPVQRDDINNCIMSFVIGCRKCGNPDAEVEYESSNLNPFNFNDNDSRRKNAVQLFDYNKKTKVRNEPPEDCDLGGYHLFPDESEDEEEIELMIKENIKDNQTICQRAQNALFSAYEIYFHTIEEPKMFPAQSC